jgi:predicted ATPase/DNA-binding XRE family transcriptional regulator
MIFGETQLNDAETFGHWLRQRRRALDLTQVDLARQIDVAPVTIRKLEGDELRPSKHLAEMLADHLGVAPQDREAFLLFARSGRQPEESPSSLTHPEQVPWREPISRRTNLPNPLTSFVGRESELAQVKELLRTRRLVTLTGSGGIGKTRLAMQAGNTLLDSFREGVWFIDLAPLSDPSQVPLAVAAVIGVREEEGGRRSVLDTLIDSLREKQSLLILDNCEHLILASAQLAETLLQACSNLTILATSREALAIAGETSFAVPPLIVPELSSLPDTEHGFSAELLADSEAVHLFVDRTQSVQPSFALTDENGMAVAQICQRLDGIPLAIELAAARLKTLSIEQLEARLDDRFRLLRAGSRTALPRHQTLRATIDWSYELLSDVEQIMLCRLSVFAGGWTLEAAEFVCADGSEPAGIHVRDILDLLSTLVDKSLVVAETAKGEKRYRLLETIRQYAREKFSQRDEWEQVRAGHLNWFLDLAEHAEQELHGPEQVMWLERLEIEYDNMLGALEWSLMASPSRQSQPAQVERGLRLAAALWWFWRVRGSPREGSKRLTAILSRPDTQRKSLVRAKALNGAGALAFLQGEYEAARAFYDESLDSGGEAGGAGEKVYALYGLGAIAQAQGDYARAHSFYGEALGLSRETGFEWGIASSLLNLGWLSLDQSEFDLAHSFLEESLEVFRKLGDKGGIARSLFNLGLILYYQGDYRRAYTLYEESLTFYRELRDKPRVAYIIDSLAYIELHEGNYEKARGLFVESLGFSREFGNRRLLADVLEGLAGLAAVERRPADAARLFGAAQALLEEIGFHLESSNRVEHEHNVTIARDQLDQAAFTAAWNEGRGLSVDQAIHFALEIKDRSPDLIEPMSDQIGE